MHIIEVAQKPADLIFSYNRMYRRADKNSDERNAS